MKRLSIFLLGTLIILLSACSLKEDKPTQPPEQEELSNAEKILNNMTLEEKIGQLFMIRPDALMISLTSEQINDPTQYGISELTAQMKDTLRQYHVGGIAMFGKNIVNPSQLTSYIDAMQETSTIALFIGVDEEGGSVSRIANAPNFDVTKFESMQSIGESGQVDKAKDVGIIIGKYLKQYTFNLDFAPVADVNTNPNNTVIGKRSFASDPHMVSSMVQTENTGFHEQGIMTCIKHFPGHGDTMGDTHTAYVAIDKTWEQLKAVELVPFVDAFASTDMIMVAHITTPNITSDHLPASLSYEMVQGKLRTQLGYQGVVISDSMSMAAITLEYSAAESAVKAILAGVDIILMPEDFIANYKGIYDAVKNGIINETRINESVLRILNLKAKYHLV